MRRDLLRGFRSRRVVGVGLVLAGGLAVGCGGAGGDGPPRIAIGTDACAECTMTVENAHFAAARRQEGATHVYDSIECLARACRKTGGQVTDAIWIADVESGVLHPQSRMTLVWADFPSPMAGGLAAFTEPGRAHEEAQRRGGVTGSLAQLVAGALHKPGAEAP